MEKTLLTAREGPVRQSGLRLATFVFLALLLMAGGTSVPAVSQNTQDCQSREDMAAQLAATYAEQQTGLGVTNVGTVIELWQTREGSSWTLLVTMPTGNSCVVGAGRDWMPLKIETSDGVAWRVGAPNKR